MSRTILSIVVPAHDEEAFIGRTLEAIHAAAEATGLPYEVIVVDDGSTDATAEIARSGGARVVPVVVRQIAAARNAGARVANGDMLVFVDADTIINGHVLQAAVGEMRKGAVGGGARAVYDANTPRWAQNTITLVVAFMRRVNWASGCFFFAQRAAFERVGGFDERYFASEEIHLSRALKRLGRFVILPETVVTSGRKAHTYSSWHTLWLVARMLRPGGLTRRDHLGFWYTRDKGKGQE